MAIINPIIVWSKPSMLCKIPTAAIIAPPGTPGAAIIVIPSIQIKPTIVSGSTVVPVSIIIAIEQDTILSVLPERWMVAHRGTTKPAMEGEMLFCMVCLRVTGMVAALDDVPRAVK